MRPRHGAARRRDRRRRRHRAGRRGKDRRADARRADRARPGRRPQRAPDGRRLSRPGPASRVRNLARRHQAQRRLLRLCAMARSPAWWRSRARARTSCSPRCPARSARRAARSRSTASPCNSRIPPTPSRAGIAYVPGDRTEALLMQRSVRENIALPFSARAAATGGRSTCAASAPGRQRHRAAADRHPRAARGAAPVRRQPAEGDDRPLDRRRRPHHPVLRPDARHRCRAPSRRSTGCCASSPARASRCCSTPPSWKRCSCVCDRAIVIFGGRVVDILPAEIADEAALDARRLWPAARGARCGRGARRSVRSAAGGGRRHEPLPAPPGLGRRAVRPVLPAPGADQAHPAGLWRGRLRVAGARRFALRLRRCCPDDRRHRRRHRSLGRFDDGADQRHRGGDDGRRQRGIRAAGGAVRARSGPRCSAPSTAC